MASLEEFNRRIKRRADRLAKNIDKLIRKVAITADTHVVLATPVDTGRARSNWIVSVGAPSNKEIEPYAPHPQFSKGSGSGTAESGNAQAALSQAQLAIGGRKLGQAIYIQNNVEYIGDLNDGTSAQAPANFVRIAVINAVKVIQKARRLTD